MSDQLSKVVAEMRTTPNAFGWSNRTVLQWADRIESAAAPVEVEGLLDLIGKYWDLAYAEGVQRRNHDTEAGEAQRTLHAIETGVATLARQLAEAKAEVAAHERNDLAETDLIHSFLQRLEQAESALAAATRRVAEVEGWISVEDRLPEDGAVTYCYEPRKGNQFVSQFHAEMPGGKPGWTEEFYERAPSIDGCAGGWGHWPFVTHWRPAFESPAKLPKEPK